MVLTRQHEAFEGVEEYGYHQLFFYADSKIMNLAEKKRKAQCVEWTPKTH